MARLADLWRDDTVADVLYPTAGLSVLQYEDVELQEACCRVYNDWLAELCAVDPVRLLGLALLATNDTARAVAELERSRDAGLRGAIVWTAPPEGSSFLDAWYEPLWSAAAALRMPISLHILGGRRASTKIGGYNRDLAGTFYSGFETRQELHRSVCELIAGGVFERHPDLHVVAAEGGIEYAANLERRLDSGLPVVLAPLRRPRHGAVGVLPAQRAPHVHERPGRAEQPALHRGGPLHVVERLSAPFGDLARLTRGDRARRRGGRRRRCRRRCAS